jgi:hypothetical protein
MPSGEQAEWHRLGFITLPCVCCATVDPLLLPVHLREFYLYAVISAAVQYIPLQGSLEWADWEVCVDIRLTDKCYCVIMLQSWAVSRNTPPAEHCISTLSRAGLCLSPGQTILQALGTRCCWVHSTLPLLFPFPNHLFQNPQSATLTCSHFILWHLFLWHSRGMCAYRHLP